MDTTSALVTEADSKAVAIIHIGFLGDIRLCNAVVIADHVAEHADDGVAVLINGQAKLSGQLVL